MSGRLAGHQQRRRHHHQRGHRHHHHKAKAGLEPARPSGIVGPRYKSSGYLFWGVLSLKNQPGSLKNYTNQPKTMKNQPRTGKSYTNQPRTMKNQPETLKTHKS